MHANRYDVVVVGAGIAGLTAASLAAEQGASVALVSIGAGAFVLGAGGVEEREVKALKNDPGFAPAMDFFLDLAASAGTALAGNLEHTVLLPTLLGGFQPMQLAPALVANSALHPFVKTRVVGFRGLTGFDAEFLAQRFNQEAEKRGLAASCDATTLQLPVPLGMPLTTLRVAQAFDRDQGFRTALAEALREAKGDCERVLLPAVLGIEANDLKRAAFVAQVGCTVGELPTLPPSIPGLRLAQRLLAHLRMRGVTMLEGYPVEQLDRVNRTCTGLRIASPGRAFRIAGDSVLLATSTGMRRLLGDAIQAVDEQQRPVDTAGKPLANNLFAACARPPHVSELRGLAGRILAGHRAAVCAGSERGAYAAR